MQQSKSVIACKQDRSILHDNPITPEESMCAYGQKMSILPQACCGT
jgi:hypothetical protein